MGKARIVSKLEPEGFYRITYISDTNISGIVARLDQNIDICDQKIADDDNADFYKLQKQNYQIEKARAQDIEFRLGEVNAYAWCADYKEIQAGTIVGTIEVDRENTGENLNIQPNWEDNAAYNSERDGIMKPVPLMNTFNQFYNLAVSPALQKWHPTYRHGEIYNIDYENDTASVNLDPLYCNRLSDRLYMNLIDNVSGAKIEYMDCNAEAFAEVDQVLVKFDGSDGYSAPTVIGFKNNPKPCPAGELVYVRVGDRAFIWDTKTDTYWEDLPNIQDYSVCLSALSSKSETTIGLPYEKLFYTMHFNADYSDFRYRMTSKPLTGTVLTQTDPGWLWDTQQLIIRDEKIYDSVTGLPVEYFKDYYWTAINTLFGETISATCDVQIYKTDYIAIFGEFRDAEINAQNNIFYGIGPPAYTQNGYSCPLDYSAEYYSYGTNAEYGNDPIVMGYPGCRFSEKTLVQVLFSAYSNSQYIRPPFPPEITYSGTRQVQAACGCNAIPWDTGAVDEGGAPITSADPNSQKKNELFSQAVEELVEYWHVDRGAEPAALVEPQTTKTECGPGASFWWQITDPVLDVRIYSR